MLTVRQFAAKIGCHKSAVQRWITCGLIPDVEMVKFNANQSQYMIPDDAVRPKIEIKKSAKTKKQFVPDTSIIPDGDHKKQLDFLKNHLSWSVRSIATALGVSTAKVRELFDELMQIDDPCNPLDCPAYATGHCEYDFATGKIMPMDEDNCPLMKKEEK